MTEVALPMRPAAGARERTAQQGRRAGRALVRAELQQVELQAVAAALNEAVAQLAAERANVLEGPRGDEEAAVRDLEQRLERHEVGEAAADGDARGEGGARAVRGDGVGDVALAQACGERGGGAGLCGWGSSRRVRACCCGRVAMAVRVQRVRAGWREMHVVDAWGGVGVPGTATRLR